MNLFQSLAALAVRRPIAIAVVAFGVALLGWLSWRELPIDMLPDLQSPTVMVSLRSGSRPPIEMERIYGERVEQLLFTVPGIQSVEQTVRIGTVVSTIVFDWNTNLDLALIDVQKAVSPLAGSPQVDEVIVRRFDPRQQPILTLGMAAPEGTPGLVDLRKQARRAVAPVLERLEGVAEVQVTGGRREEIRVQVDRYLMDSFGVNLDLVSSRLRAENVDVSAGTLEEGNRIFNVRGRTRFTSLDQIEAVVLRYIAESDGTRRPVRVGDVSTVTFHQQEIDHIVFVDGVEGVGLAIYKESGANSVQVSGRVKSAVSEIAEDLPGVQIREITDNAFLIVEALSDLQYSALAGVLLAVMILALFLRSAGTTLIVTVSVPVSVFCSVFAMHVWGYSLNIVTLAGLALGAGMLVDNAIVVVESMFRRIRQGDSQSDASVLGTAQVAGAITASTFTTIVVFMPVFFVQGLAARLIEGIAFTVTVSLLASLGVAIFLIPALGRWFLPRASNSSGSISAERTTSRARKATERTVATLLKAPGLVVLIALAGSGAGVYLLSSLGTELLPPSDPRQFSVRVVGPSGQRVESTARMVEGIEFAIRDLADDNLQAIMSEVGKVPDNDRIIRTEVTEENTARITARMVPEGPTGRDVADALAEHLEDIPGTELVWELSRTALSEALGTSGPPILVEIAGDALPDIERGAAMARKALASLPELWNVRSSFEGGAPELHVELNQAMADALGIHRETVSRVLQANLDGLVATQFQVGDEQAPIVIRERPVALDELPNVTFRMGPRLISLGEISTFERHEGAREIFRRDQRRIARVTAEVSREAELPQAVAEIHAVLEDLALPSGITARVRGEETSRKQTFGELQLAAILAVVLVFMVLAGTFESFLHPFTVLAPIPLALCGVAAVLVPLGDPVGVMAMLGMLVLAGVAVNDSVLLLVTARQQMEDGIERARALSIAAGIRLRPILMTTLTTTLALAPLVFGGGEGATLRRPMALTIMGGLTASTVGSLLVLPCLYLFLDRFRRKKRDVAGNTPD